MIDEKTHAHTHTHTYFLDIYFASSIQGAIHMTTEYFEKTKKIRLHTTMFSEDFRTFANSRKRKNTVVRVGM